MSTPNSHGPKSDFDAESAILDYLREHPDLLSRHPDVVEQLHVPHVCGKAVSLVEYQVSVLRDQCRDLRRRMQTLVKNARDNEELGQRIHQLALDLMDCRSIDEIFSGLYQSMLDDFTADFATVRVFAAPRDPENQGLGEFAGGDADAREIFAEVLRTPRPTCGRLKREQLDFLFAGAGANIGSGAFIPLGRVESFGLLAICSRDVHRYHPGVGTVFLRQLGEIVTRVLAPHIESG